MENNELNITEHPSPNDPELIKDEQLREAIDNQLSKIRTQSMILGFRVCCQSILNKIVVFEKSPGSKSNNDYKRLMKDIKKFIEIGLSRKMNDNGEVVMSEDVNQTNNTKLMEDVNEGHANESN